MPIGIAPTDGATAAVVGNGDFGTSRFVSGSNAAHRKWDVRRQGARVGSTNMRRLFACRLGELQGEFAKERVSPSCLICNAQVGSLGPFADV
jgi:hypothetical protein